MISIPQTTYSLQLIILSPLALMYKGQVLALTLVNEQGKFDILPLHANFITLIKDSITIYESKEKEKTIPIEEGIAKVFENNVNIFVGIKTIS